MAAFCLQGCTELASATRNGGRRMQLASPCRPAVQRVAAVSCEQSSAAGPRPQASHLPPLRRRNSDKNKFKSRQQLEMEYYDEFSESVALQEEKRGPMTALTLLAAVPRLLRFYIIPAPIRFVVYLAWVLVEEVKYWLRKQAVLIGAKLDMVSMRRQGKAAAYHLRETALKRLHGKESLLQPLRTAVGF